MKKRSRNVVFALLLVVVLLVAIISVMGSSTKAAQQDLEKSKAEVEDTVPPEATPVPKPTAQPGPQKEEVLAMRESVLDGMEEEDRSVLCALVKKANGKIESKAIYNRFFQILSDPDDLLWNSFNQTGEIQIGWAHDGKISKPDVMKEENLTETEFYEKYGKEVAMYNDYDAEDFAQMLEKCRDAVENEALRSDLQYVIDEVRLAAETHDVTHVENFYHVLHDMDYFLLNYRLDTEGQYIRDKSTISKYYGVLAVYGGTKE